jgi:hypothetical protein
LLAFEHITGAEAIVRCAREFGVISEEGLNNPELVSAIRECDCCAAAHSVLLEYFKTHGDSDDLESIENAWKTILKRLNRFRVGPVPSESEMKDTPDCRQMCSNLAPVIFDLLLQEVRRNS